MKKLSCSVAGVLLCVAAGAASAAPVSFADLARHAQYKMVRISPDGTHAAATSVLADGRTVLMLLDLATNKGVSISVRGGDDVLDFWWASPKHVVYSVAEHLGGLDAPIPTGELYSIEADGGSPTMLYGYRLNATETGSRLQHATRQRGTAEFLSRIDGDSDHILVAITSWETVSVGSGGALTEVYKMDVRNGTKRLVANAPMREAAFLADHHGHVRFAFGDDLDGNRVIYMRPAEGGDWELLKQPSDDRDWPIVFSADGKSVWFECPGQRAGFGICGFDPAARTMTHVWSNPHVEATMLARGLAANSVIGVHFTDGRPATTLFRKRDAGAEVLMALMKKHPGEDAYFLSGTDDGSKAIAVVEADVDPGAFFLYDRAADTFRLLAQRAAWINPTQLGRAVPFTFKTRDGLTEQGYVTWPPGKVGAKNLPMVVYVHGGPYGVRDRWTYDPFVQAMATRGYAVLQVNFRGSGGYGFEFLKAGWMEWGGKMQDDVTDATRWAIAQGIADPNRICIHGGSYGGYAALEGAVKEPDLYKCAIGYVGVYDLPMMYNKGDIQQNLYGEAYLKRVLGTDMASLAQRSPVNQLDSLKASVMLIVGGRDIRVPPAQGKKMHEALLARRIPHQWMYKANEGHGFYDEKNIAELFENVDAFLSANIGPGVGTPATPVVSAAAQ